MISCSGDAISSPVGAIRQLLWAINVTLARITRSGDVISERGDVISCLVGAIRQFR